MNQDLRILLIEDNPGDADLIEYMLHEAYVGFELKCVDRLSAGIEQIKADGFDVILLDLGLPDSYGLETLIKLIKIEPEAPVIVLTSLADEAIGTEAVRGGAQDYLIKGQIDKKLLSRSINHAIERKLVQEALRKSETNCRQLYDQFHALLDALPDSITLRSPDFKVLWTNRRSVAGLGIEPEDVVGLHCYNLWHNRSEPCDNCPAIESFRTGEPAENIATWPDGKIRELRTIPIKESGSVIYVIEISRDITELRKLEEQLRQSQKMEVIGQLSGGIAHDLNNILTAIIGFSTLTEMGMDVNDPKRVNLSHVIDAAKRAAELTRSLLAFSRKQILNPQPVDLIQVIDKTKKFLERIISEDIDFHVVFKKEGLIVNADSGQIEQVLTNLVTNARDAMPTGGLLSIEANEVILDDNFIKAHGYGEIGPYAVITISDTGMGMNPEICKRVFEPFFTTKEIGKGTGLGLSIVYGIIKQHNGFINVSSEPGIGTTFNIYIPLIQAVVENVRKSRVADLQGGKETVLVVDDDFPVRDLLEKTLSQFGYTVITAIDGNDAVAKFRANQTGINLVILDVIMPKMNGKEVYDEIRKTNPTVKAIFMSGYTSDIIHKRGVLDPSLEYIPKPIDPRQLLLKVREVLGTENNVNE